MTYPTWVFDESPIADPLGLGERAVRFIRALKHPKTGKPFQLDRWQERIVRRIYGPRHPDGRMIVRKVVMMIPRGGRKTTLGAAMALLHAVGPERVRGGQIILAAYDREQARIAYDEALGMVQADARIIAVTRVRDFRHEIVHPQSRTTLRAVSSDANAQNGKTPTLVVYDEIHAWKKRELYDVLHTGLSKTVGTLSVVISQAGRGQECLAHEVFDNARKIARGEIVSESTLPILFETAADADWKDEAVWHAANPGLALGYPNIEALRDDAAQAAHRPAMREKFRNDNLNVWLDHSTDPFVEMATYDLGARPIDPTTLKGKPCWIGVDMSTTTDLTAVVAAFRDKDGGFLVLPQFFVPGDNLRRRADIDGVPYPEWAKQGVITATPGNVIDYKAVVSHIRDLVSKHDVREINFDPAYAMPVMSPLQDDGLPVATMRQGWVTQSPALNTLERAVVSGKFQHGGNPVLRWCFSNVAIHTDSAGNRTMHKGKSTDRIDGAVATWMAVERAAANGGTRSIFDHPDISIDDLVF